MILALALDFVAAGAAAAALLDSEAVDLPYPQLVTVQFRVKEHD